jgi:hypothetical protein
VRYRPVHFGWLVIAGCSAAPAGPAPAVQWTGRDITTTGLPAIASDGSAVVIAHRDNDGGRGNPNLTLIEKDRSDRTIRELVVLHANDIDHVDAAQITARFEQAAGWLRERHADRRLVAMTPLAMTDVRSATAVAAGVTLRWAPSQLVIERERGTAVVRTTPASWLARDRPMCHDCSEVCHNEAFLGGGHVDLDRSVALVVVSYHGTDICWEPSSQQHVVAW